MFAEELEMIAHSTALQMVIGVYVCAVMGSFLNVVLYRGPLILKRAWANRCHDTSHGEKPYPDKFTLSSPPSHCPTCGEGIKGYQNVPIVSWFALRGISACCGSSISPRYVATEIGSALYGTIVLSQIGFTWVSLLVLVISFVLVVVMGVWWELRADCEPKQPVHDMWMNLRVKRLTGEEFEALEPERNKT
jgi:leader peptidase (prepilin peptidase)/N-methyltransferase